MDRYARIVFGYHGTHPAFAERLIRGEISIAKPTNKSKRPRKRS